MKNIDKGPVLVSACLLGIKCKYNGGDNKSERVLKFLEGRDHIKMCPESMGGLESPRLPSEIEPGYDGVDVVEGRAKVYDEDGKDVTAEFLRGAQISLDQAQKHQASLAILKESSPSCGGNKIYTGRFEGQKKVGQGVTAALLRKHGIRVITEENL